MTLTPTQEQQIFEAMKRPTLSLREIRQNAERERERQRQEDEAEMSLIELRLRPR